MAAVAGEEDEEPAPMLRLPNPLLPAAPPIEFLLLQRRSQNPLILKQYLSHDGSPVDVRARCRGALCGALVQCK